MYVFKISVKSWSQIFYTNLKAESDKSNILQFLLVYNSSYLEKLNKCIAVCCFALGQFNPEKLIFNTAL